MKLINCTLGLILTSSLVLTMSCGDEGTADKASGGTSSAGGNASGGTLGTTGGATSGGTSSGGTNSTSGGSAGTANSTGGTNSAGGTGGTGTPGAGCPTTAPGDGDDCNPDDTDGQCRYTGLSCTCGGGFQGGGGGDGMGEWNCMGDGADCPSTPPEDGDPCPGGGDAGGGNGGPGGGDLNCPYPTVDCECGGFGQGADEWSCDPVEAPIECPNTAPEDGSPCTGMGACPDIMCACFNEEWNCFGGGGGGAPGFP